MTTDAAPRRRPQLSLGLAAVLVVVEGLAVLAVGISVLTSVSGSRLGLDVAAIGFFGAYAVALLVCARGLWHQRRWSRGPVVFAQLIQLGVAWSFFGGSTPAVALTLVAIAVAVLALVLAPASTAALLGE
ncbi:MAG TPA: hypothetical protein VFJ14_14395 [Nocardioidaceae bacterium]|nr:hypothetical protein [Nocardioidaceae bacterium]